MQGDYIMPEQDTRGRTERTGGRRATTRVYPYDTRISRVMCVTFDIPWSERLEGSIPLAPSHERHASCPQRYAILPESKANSRCRAVKDEEANEGTGHFCLHTVPSLSHRVGALLIG